ncbi:NAD(P)/FAD-dependent oxidoreductase [Asticcacaulis tiandongensis]|uniref:NAD(P)/FAD-dependent oxidoreductase n=1 Tax=Asticcacaulis tiandongensis TaxID=2565365 RepID=UPI00112C4013|nr:FAD-dependent oxidoreductase [Asticcacaulis tiandongensis]
MSVSAYSLIIIGGGVTGLCVGLRALDVGFSVKLISKDAVGETTSALSAGMIAPALEAMTEADPKASFIRYKAAHDYWRGFAENVGLSAIIDMAQPAVWLWSGDSGPSEDEMLKRFEDMGAKAKPVSDEGLKALGYKAPFQAAEITGDWLLAAEPVLGYLKSLFIERGGQWIDGEVASVSGTAVSLQDGTALEAGQVAVCAGYESVAFASALASLSGLKPIKGHLLDVAAKSDPQLAGRIIRAPWGYWVSYEGLSKFGATMQSGQGDTVIEPAMVESLTQKSGKMASRLSPSLKGATPRVGVRAATADGLPIIGRDAPSGVYVATAMRRNGWIYAPYAAEVLVAQMTGMPVPEGAEDYSPDRINA